MTSYAVNSEVFLGLHVLRGLVLVDYLQDYEILAGCFMLGTLTEDVCFELGLHALSRICL